MSQHITESEKLKLQSRIKSCTLYDSLKDKEALVKDATEHVGRYVSFNVIRAVQREMGIVFSRGRNSHKIVTTLAPKSPVSEEKPVSYKNPNFQSVMLAPVDSPYKSKFDYLFSEEERSSKDLMVLWNKWEQWRVTLNRPLNEASAKYMIKALQAIPVPKAVEMIKFSLDIKCHTLCAPRKGKTPEDDEYNRKIQEYKNICGEASEIMNNIGLEVIKLAKVFQRLS